MRMRKRAGDGNGWNGRKKEARRAPASGWNQQPKTGTDRLRWGSGSDQWDRPVLPPMARTWSTYRLPDTRSATYICMSARRGEDRRLPRLGLHIGGRRAHHIGPRLLDPSHLDHQFPLAAMHDLHRGRRGQGAVVMVTAARDDCPRPVTSREKPPRIGNLLRKRRLRNNG
jgi:hypothetical protein